MLIWSIFLLILSSVNGQNERCLTSDGRYGVCQYFQYCGQAKQDYSQRIGVTFCNSYNRNLICCPSTPPTQTISSRNSRISERKCEEYSRSTKQVSFVAPLSLGSTSANQQSFENYKCVQSTSLITGGQKTRLGEFPHMAAIGWETLDGVDFGCGGSLISNNFVLTAAHCNIKRGRPGSLPKFVRLGDQDLKSQDDGSREIDVPIQQFIMHERYDRSSKKNDIGLVKLANSVSFTDFIRPACIWTNQQIKTSITTATGYGKTSYYSQNSDELLKVQLKIFDNNHCYNEGFNNIDSSQLCVGSENRDEARDTCSGDSGGPLQIKHGANKCIYYIIGITSYGTSYCGYSPSIYTRVSNYIDWIESKVWP